jgi:4-amino-4-deoxy-L-arabinose transferase-like glycosyltransferase/tetratricopeptide (TPR) repeat protein
MNPFKNPQISFFTTKNAGIIIVCVLFLFVGLLCLNNVFVYTPDSARYLSWAKSLSTFEGFRDLTTPRPARYVVHAPLYPILIAPVALFFPYGVVPAKFITILFGVAVIVALYFWLRKTVGIGWAIAGSFLLASNPTMILYSTQILSDVPFVLAILLFFTLSERLTENKPQSWRLQLALIGTVVAGVFLREVGLTLMPAGTVVLILKRERKLAFLLLFVTLLVYGMWYVRNEVVIATIEQPPMRNSQMFLSHIFTSNQASLFDEFGARLSNNVAVYGPTLVRLPFMAEIVVRNISALSPAQFPVKLVLDIMPYLYVPFFVVTVLLVIIGAITESRHRTRFILVSTFLVCYLIPILLYPINDARFLLPILVLLLYYFVAGGKYISDLLTRFGLNSPYRKTVIAIGLIVLALPNVAWTVTYAGNNWGYGKSPEQFFDDVRSLPYYPELFGRPLDLAGKWIEEHTDSSAIIMCRWKELAFWTNGRQVLDTDPETLTEQFDNLLRDYAVPYIVTVHSKGGLREYESQFGRSTKFKFATVQLIGNVEIVGVYGRDQHIPDTPALIDSSELVDRMHFGEAMHLLQEDRPAEAESLLVRLPVQLLRQAPVSFAVGAAKELAGHLDEAEAIFEQFQSLQQAGSVVQQAWYHLDAIARWKAAERAAPGTDRAERFQGIALSYWGLGYRGHAAALLDRAIQEDGSFFPALIFRAICSLQLNDTTSARIYLGKSQKVDPTNSLIHGVAEILDIKSRISRTHVAGETSSLRLDLAENLRAVGLREEALDELHLNVQTNSNDIRSLRMLVDIYLEKRRFASARTYLRNLVSRAPGDVALKEELENLQRRW